MSQHVSSAGRKDLSPRMLYPIKIYFRNYGNIKIFSHKESLREFVASRPTLRMARESSLNRKKMLSYLRISQRRNDYSKHKYGQTQYTFFS